MVLADGISIEGVSIGGLETCIDLPEFKVALDIGRVPNSVVARNTILFTHAHMDHMGGVAWHCATRSLRGLTPPRYVLEQCHTEAFGRMMDAWRALDRSTMAHELVAVKPGDTVDLHGGRKARCFRTTHIVPTLGWCVLETRRKLRAEWQAAPREALIQAREQGVVLHEEQEIPRLAFCGDTTIDVLEREELARHARVLVLECTFLDDQVTVAEAREKGHVHLDEICARPELFDKVGTLVLSHVSPRWTPSLARRILDRRLPAALRAKCEYFLPTRESET
ncbi:MAG: hypothetical protein RIT40_1671 [Planctomycetota bacterium]|jgi:ribonuclease Z